MLRRVTSPTDHRRPGLRVRKLLLLALLACAFAAVQFAAVRHAVDFKAHTSGDLCKTCLSFAAVATGNVGHAQHVPLLPQTAAIIPHASAVFVSVQVITARARGPPLAS